MEYIHILTVPSTNLTFHCPIHSSVWSSLVPPPSPEVTGQAYTFPTSLSTLTTTHTLRGITHKSILCESISCYSNNGMTVYKHLSLVLCFNSIPVGLHSGHIAALPKDILDPRRALEITDEMRSVLCVSCP